jgi:hypothetical protein
LGSKPSFGLQNVGSEFSRNGLRDKGFVATEFLGLEILNLFSFLSE